MAIIFLNGKEWHERLRNFVNSTYEIRSSRILRNVIITVFNKAELVVYGMLRCISPNCNSKLQLQQNNSFGSCEI